MLIYINKEYVKNKTKKVNLLLLIFSINIFFILVRTKIIAASGLIPDMKLNTWSKRYKYFFIDRKDSTVLESTSFGKYLLYVISEVIYFKKHII